MFVFYHVQQDYHVSYNLLTLCLYLLLLVSLAVLCVIGCVCQLYNKEYMMMTMIYCLCFSSWLNKLKHH